MDVPKNTDKDPYVLEFLGLDEKAKYSEIANIHASEYQLYLPSKEELKQKLMDWTREMDDGE